MGTSLYDIFPKAVFVGSARLLTFLRLQSRLGGKPLKFQVVCPQNGTAALKGRRHVWERIGSEIRVLGGGCVVSRGIRQLAGELS